MHFADPSRTYQATRCFFIRVHNTTPGQLRKPCNYTVIIGAYSVGEQAIATHQQDTFGYIYLVTSGTSRALSCRITN